MIEFFPKSCNISLIHFFVNAFTYSLGETVLKVLHTVLYIGCLLRQSDYSSGHIRVSGDTLIWRAVGTLHDKSTGATPNDFGYRRCQDVNLPIVRWFQQAAFTGKEEYQLDPL